MLLGEQTDDYLDVPGSRRSKCINKEQLITASNNQHGEHPVYKIYHSAAVR